MPYNGNGPRQTYNKNRQYNLSQKTANKSKNFNQSLPLSTKPTSCYLIKSDNDYLLTLYALHTLGKKLKPINLNPISLNLKNNI
ncbi:MAG: hypothetical protein JWM09_787 [Francisellaceae bacterium]|nr:hypothetical protein [Francisellaceae bacterium]